ncbi:unnamed protein product [Gongylonema pulchrum]|uniref:OmpA-like domain-containing protein n=1 Tax=Gongylonema pulchrum TaxID=637853 RepID=A0A183E5J4_9BILA|nr:unnamed protein product [Gongylonema pulchrum]
MALVNKDDRTNATIHQSNFKKKMVVASKALHRSLYGCTISIKSDPTKLQNKEYQDAAALALQLRSRGYIAYSTENRIRIGPRGDSRWFACTDPALRTVLNADAAPQLPGK